MSRCLLCEGVFDVMGALLFSPPDSKVPDSTWYGVVKHHICPDCYTFIEEYKPTLKKWKDILFSP